MIIKGKAAGAVGWWGKHLMRDDTNDRAEVIEISGLVAEDVPTALKEMQAIAAQSRSRGDFMYSANINPRDNERLTPEQWQEAVDTLEKNMGLEGHQRVVVEHEKDGRIHRHVVWNRVDIETLRVADIGFNYYTHERTARELEERFDLARTPSLHGEHRPGGRPDRPPELWEQRAEERGGIDRKEMKAELTELWHNTISGEHFAAALEERGYILAVGDRRSFCVVDSAGDVHSLARRLEGVKAKEVTERLSDIDRENLPSVEEARAEQRSRPEQERAAGIAEPIKREEPEAQLEQEIAGSAPPEILAAAEPKQDRREAAREATQAAWSERRDAEVSRVTGANTPTPIEAGSSVVDAASGIAESLGNFVLGFLGGGSSKPPMATDQVEEIKAQRRAAAALENIRDSMERGEGLSPSDIQNLTPTHLENIRLRGDDYLRETIERMERDRQRERDYGRERER